MSPSSGLQLRKCAGHERGSLPQTLLQRKGQLKPSNSRRGRWRQSGPLGAPREEEEKGNKAWELLKDMDYYYHSVRHTLSQQIYSTTLC